MNNNDDAGQNLIAELLGGIDQAANGPTYEVGVTYQADAFHIADALAHGIKLPPTGSFVCSHVGEDGCCWSNDVEYVGDNVDDVEPKIDGVGWMCAPPYALERGAVTKVTE